MPAIQPTPQPSSGSARVDVEVAALLTLMPTVTMTAEATIQETYAACQLARENVVEDDRLSPDERRERRRQVDWNIQAHQDLRQLLDPPQHIEDAILVVAEAHEAAGLKPPPWFERVHAVLKQLDEEGGVDLGDA